MAQYTRVVTGLRATQSKRAALPPPWPAPREPRRMWQNPLEAVAQLAAGAAEVKLKLLFKVRLLVQIDPLAVASAEISTLPRRK